jgi:hypothetical protein
MKLDSDTLNYVHMRSTAYPFEAQTYTNYEGMDFFQTRREMRRVLYQEEVREEWAKKRARMMHGLRAILVVFLFVCVLRYMIFKRVYEKHVANLQKIEKRARSSHADRH